MSQQSARPARRYASPRANRKKGEHDPYLFILTIQLAVCGLLLLLSYAAADAKPPFLEEVASQYRRLISAREVTLPVSAVEDAARRYTELRDRAADAVSSLITGLLKPRAAPPADTAAAADAALTGAGGWMGTGDGDGRAAPSSCALSPLVLSAWAQTPVVGRVTSAFGYRAHPVSGSDDFHKGIDIAAAQGSGVYAVLPGTVAVTDSSPIYGNYITLDHGNGLLTTYCHCDSIVVRAGERLRTGELLALVGSTGISSGPHVEFQISKDGKYYNPAWVLEGMNGYGV